MFQPTFDLPIFMFKFHFLILFACLILFSSQTNAGPLFGLEEFISDTSVTNPGQQLEHVLTFHPMLTVGEEDDFLKVEPHISINKTGPFLLALAFLFAFSLARFVFPSYFLNLLQIFTTFSVSKRHIKEQLENDNRASLWFNLIFFISAGFIIYQFLAANRIIPVTGRWYINYAICTMALIVLLTIRTSLIRLIGWVFKRPDSVQLYLFNKKIINEFSGLILFPLCSLILISSGNLRNSMLMVGGVIYVVLFIYSYLKNFQVLTNLFRVSFVHFILYFCALELLPVLVLIKAIR